MRNRFLLLIISAIITCSFLIAFPYEAKAGLLEDSEIQKSIEQINSQVNDLKLQVDSIDTRISQTQNQLNQIKNDTGIGIVIFLFGAFCALWAQNTGRSSWLWFFLGLFFNVLAVLCVLYLNGDGTSTSYNNGRNGT